MNKDEARVRAATWREIGIRLSGMASTEHQDINEWLCHASGIADARASECYAVAKQLPAPSKYPSHE